MFRRILALLIGFPIGIILVAIAVSNRQPVDLILDPFRPETPALSIELPFYIYLMVALVVGVILGGIATWMGQSRWRQTARSQGKRAARWQAEADRLAREREAAGDQADQRLAISGR
ncbi:LapA family protein [Hyphomicrobium sp.]|uniref:LapA family protein n=1 Tax=Hyphomicrobium sp. TaxID=82 RepID=UPI001E10ACCF|nr:LapA family protein [Hyphomicrobium sp.]MBY0559829.1 LapA family protein [Hyphomicrobium sp.]